MRCTVADIVKEKLTFVENEYYIKLGFWFPAELLPRYAIIRSPLGKKVTGLYVYSIHPTGGSIEGPLFMHNYKLPMHNYKLPMHNYKLPRLATKEEADKMLVEATNEAVIDHCLRNITNGGLLEVPF